MDPLYVQHLRYKLQKRVSRLNSVDAHTFGVTLMQFWRFFDQQPTYTGVADELLHKVPNADATVERILNGEGLYGNTEEEAAAIGYHILHRLAKPDPLEELVNIGWLYVKNMKLEESIEVVREVFLDPFYEYIDEKLDDQRAMLALLLRYKHRSEWFHREQLWELSQTKRRGEHRLALDLYSYLYDQGIDFYIEPSSITGEIDLIAAQHSDDPLLLDAKIFDAGSRGRAYIQKGFSQIYTYTQQYNEPFGYLVIYKTTDRDLHFSLRRSTNIPSVVYNHKTIFLLTVDIFPHDRPVSQRPPLDPVEVTEEYLIGSHHTADEG